MEGAGRGLRSQDRTLCSPRRPRGISRSLWPQASAQALLGRLALVSPCPAHRFPSGRCPSHGAGLTAGPPSLFLAKRRLRGPGAAAHTPAQLPAQHPRPTRRTDAPQPRAGQCPGGDSRCRAQTTWPSAQGPHKASESLSGSRRRKHPDLYQRKLPSTSVLLVSKPRVLEFQGHAVHTTKTSSRAGGSQGLSGYRVHLVS